MKNFFPQDVLVNITNKNHKRDMFMLTEDGIEAIVTNYKFIFSKDKSDHLLAINVDKFQKVLFNSFDSRTQRSIINDCTADYIIIDFEDLDEIKFYIIELGQHDNAELRHKYNATMRCFVYLVNLYLQKKSYWSSTIKYVLIFYKPWHEQKLRKISQPIFEDSQCRYYKSRTNTCNLQDVELKLKQFNTFNSDIIESL